MASERDNKKPKRKSIFASLFPSYYGYGKKDEGEKNDAPNLTELKDEIKKLKDELDVERKRLDALPNPFDLGHNIPVHSFSHDKYFRHQLDRGNLTLQLNTDELQRNMAGGGGGGTPGFPSMGSVEWTYVNSTGCVQDPDDIDCAIPFDIAFRDQLSIVDGAITLVRLNAFVNMHNECKFRRCSSESYPSDTGYLDRWRVCNDSSGGAGGEDIFLNLVYLEAAGLSGFANPVIQLESGGQCYYWVEQTTGETETNPPGEVIFYDTCEDSNCAVPAPCVCDTSTTVLSNTYSIAANLTGCVTCRNNGLPVWDKIFTREVVGGTPTCRWFPAAGKSYGGKDLSETNTLIKLNTVSCRWELSIYCYNLAGSNICIWFGTKDMGLTPAGTYTRVTPDPDTGQTPCDATATVTVS